MLIRHWAGEGGLRRAFARGPLRFEQEAQAAQALVEDRELTGGEIEAKGRTLVSGSGLEAVPPGEG